MSEVMFNMAKKRGLFRKKKQCDSSMWIAYIALIIGLLWLMSELKLFVLNIPWLPLIIVLYAIDCVIKAHNR